MNYRVILVTLLVSSGIAYAQAPDAPINITPDGTVSPTSLVEGSGVKVGEGTVLHPIVGVETGVVSNVFYEDVNSNTNALLRLLVEVQSGSLPND